jgi:hypothetical protein
MILYLADADITAGFFDTLTESPPSAIEEAQGWTVDKNPDLAAGYCPDVWRAAAEFGSFLPSAFTGYGYRTVNPLSGSFASGSWALAFKVKSNSYYAQVGKVYFRLWKSTAADGSGAEPVSVWQQSSLFLSFTAADQYKTGLCSTAVLGGVTFDNEYLFLEIAWFCTTSGGNNAAAVAWVHNEGAAEALTSPPFTPADPPLTIDLTGGGISSAEAFGLPTIAQDAAGLTIDLTGGGISSAEAFGLPTIAQDAAGLTIDLTGGGISSAEAFGLPTITQDAAGVSRWPWSCPAPAFSWQIQPSRPRQEIHICVLTGGHVSLPDIELPISSWQARLRNGDPTYVSAIVPNALTYADAIIARTGGQLKVYKGYQFIDLQGGRFLALVAETTLSSIRHDTGPRSSSVTLVGYATITNAAPKTFVYDTLTYKSLQADGRRRWRTGLKLNLSEAMAGDTWTFIARPGDTVTHQGESMVVGFISLAVSATFELVELVEA